MFEAIEIDLDEDDAPLEGRTFDARAQALAERKAWRKHYPSEGRHAHLPGDASEDAYHARMIRMEAEERLARLPKADADKAYRASQRARRAALRVETWTESRLDRMLGRPCPD